jgi:hypothetical protein
MEEQLKQLQAEVATLRQEVTALRQEVTALRPRPVLAWEDGDGSALRRLLTDPHFQKEFAAVLQHWHARQAPRAAI